MCRVFPWRRSRRPARRFATSAPSPTRLRAALRPSPIPTRLHSPCSRCLRAPRSRWRATKPAQRDGDHGRSHAVPFEQWLLPPGPTGGAGRGHPRSDPADPGAGHRHRTRRRRDLRARGRPRSQPRRRRRSRPSMCAWPRARPATRKCCVFPKPAPTAACSSATSPPRRTARRPIARCRSSATPSSTRAMSIPPTAPTRPRPTRSSTRSVSCSIRAPVSPSTVRACGSSTRAPVLPPPCTAMTA